MVLGWRRPGRVGSCRFQLKSTHAKHECFFLSSGNPVFQPAGENSPPGTPALPCGLPCDLLLGRFFTVTHSMSRARCNATRAGKYRSDRGRNRRKSAPDRSRSVRWVSLHLRFLNYDGAARRYPHQFQTKTAILRSRLPGIAVFVIRTCKEDCRRSQRLRRGGLPDRTPRKWDCQRFDTVP